MSRVTARMKTKKPAAEANNTDVITSKIVVDCGYEQAVSW